MHTLRLPTNSTDQLLAVTTLVCKYPDGVPLIITFREVSLVRIPFANEQVNAEGRESPYHPYFFPPVMADFLPSSLALSVAASTAFIVAARRLPCSRA